MGVPAPPLRHLAGPRHHRDVDGYPAGQAAARGLNGDIARHATASRHEWESGAAPGGIARRLKSLLAAAVDGPRSTPVASSRPHHSARMDRRRRANIQRRRPGSARPHHRADHRQVRTGHRAVAMTRPPLGDHLSDHHRGRRQQNRRDDESGSAPVLDRPHASYLSLTALRIAARSCASERSLTTSS